jgi:AcrR family transcriptional regulator
MNRGGQARYRRVVPASTPDRLREAAWTLVRDEGFSAATSRRITEAAGANLAAITYHYGSKDALIGAALVEQLQGWTAPLTEAMAAGDPDPDAKVAVAITTMLDRFAVNGRDVVAIFRAVLTDDTLPGVRDAVARWLQEFRAFVAAVVTEQQAAGLVPDTVDPEPLAAAFTAFGLGVIAQSAVDPSPPSANLVISEFLKLLVRPL